MCSANIVLKIEEALGSADYNLKVKKDRIELTKGAFYKYEMKKLMGILNRSSACKSYYLITTVGGEILLRISV